MKIPLLKRIGGQARRTALLLSILLVSALAAAGLAAEEGGVFRSRDRGETWQRVNSLNPRPMYFSKIRIDPNNPQRIFVLGQQLHVSEDAGLTFSDRAARGVHPDHHDLWIDPRDSNRMILGGDGGPSISFDGAEHWRMIDNLPIAQVYKLGLDMQTPYSVYAGLQDNGTWAGPSQVRDRRGIRNADWVNVHSGDGFYAAIDPGNHSVVYAQSQRGRIVRVDMKSGERQRIQPVPAQGGAYRWNWSSPLVLSRHSQSTLYAAANLILKSSDRGLSWKAISPDLTSRVDRSQLDIMQVPEARMLSRHDGVASYGTITALAESPLDPLVLYAGSDDGKLQGTRDGGLSWTDLSPRIIGAPRGAQVSSLAASSRLAGRVYAAFDNHRNDDYRPYAFVSDDFGFSWRSIRAGLAEASINVLIEHPANPRLLFAGCETGLFISVDEGEMWQRMDGSLPTVAVDDLLIHPRSNDLVVGTHGRGIWILDDITPLQEWGELRAEDPFRLFSVRQAVAFNPLRPQAWSGQAEFAADNPPRGARIRYRINTEGLPLELDVLDSQGRHLRRLTSLPEPGIHQTIWDLRLPVLVSPQPAAGEHWPRGPRVMPGRYSVRLRSQGWTQEREFSVLADSEAGASPQDLRLRQDLLLDLYALQAPLREAQLAAVQAADAASAGRSGAQPQRLEASQISRSATQARRDLMRHDRSARALFDAIEGATTRPTADQVRLTRQLFEEVKSQLERLNTLLAQRLPNLYRELDGARLPSNLPSPIPMPGRAGKEQQH